jgi:hypothetical protein
MIAFCVQGKTLSEQKVGEMAAMEHNAECEAALSRDSNVR